MFEMYLADDMNDGGKTVFLINNDTMYVVDYNKETYLFLMEKQTTDFITDAGLNSEPVDKNRMINPTLIKTFN